MTEQIKEEKDYSGNEENVNIQRIEKLKEKTRTRRCSS